MRGRISVFFLAVMYLISCSFGKGEPDLSGTNLQSHVAHVKMSLSAFGVESGGFPNIEANLNFKDHLSICKVSYYDPKFESIEYSLTSKEMDTVLNLLQKVDLRKLKKEYTADRVDQPTSTIIISTDPEVFEIRDNGLVGEYPLNKLYEIVYKLDKTVH